MGVLGLPGTTWLFGLVAKTRDRMRSSEKDFSKRLLFVIEGVNTPIQHFLLEVITERAVVVV